jgi:Protein of unknown function (DUF1236)
MRISWLSSIAGAALLTSGGLAAAQMESSPGHMTGTHQGSSQDQPGALQNPSRHAGPMRGVNQGRSSANEQGPHSTEGIDRGRSVAMGERGQQSGSHQSQRSLEERRSVASVNLSSDQKTRLHDIVMSGTLRRVDHANFALSIGTRIPRSVRIYGVPSSIVAIVPQYRGFDYIVVGNELLIVDPRTLAIVDVLPV